VVPHIALEEIGAPYERQLVNLAQGEHKSGAYLKINPHGKVPALAVDGMVLTENVAILTFHPFAPFSPRRADVCVTRKP